MKTVYFRELEGTDFRRWMFKDASHLMVKIFLLIDS